MTSVATSPVPGHPHPLERNRLPLMQFLWDLDSPTGPRVRQGQSRSFLNIQGDANVNPPLPPASCTKPQDHRSNQTLYCGNNPERGSARHSTKTSESTLRCHPFIPLPKQQHSAKQCIDFTSLLNSTSCCNQTRRFLLMVSETAGEEPTPSKTTYLGPLGCPMVLHRAHPTVQW